MTDMNVGVQTTLLRNADAVGMSAVASLGTLTLKRDGVGIRKLLDLEDIESGR